MSYSCWRVVFELLRRIVYYVMRSKNEVLCAAAGRLVAECSEADNQPKHIKPFLLRITYTIFSSNLHNKLFKTCEETR
jgi:hypothetical protein